MAALREDIISARWGKQLYEEAREEIGQISVPHETIQKLMKAETATPGVPVTKKVAAVPEAVTDILFGGLQTTAMKYTTELLYGTREQKAELVAKLYPAQLQTEEVKAPEFTPKIVTDTYKVGEGINVKIPTVVYPETPKVADTEIGKVLAVFPEDYPTQVTDVQKWSDYISQQIEKSKAESPENKEYWQTTTIGGTNIEIPDIVGGITDFFGNIGKWALILVGAVAGIYILGKYIGRGKK